MKKYRKFKEHKEHIKKEKNISKKAIYVWIIAGLMIFSIAGFTIMESVQQTKSYNKIQFKSDGQKWTAEISKKRYSFYFFPSEIESINSADIKYLKDSKIIYITFNPNQKYLQAIDLVRFELENDFINLNIFPMQATTVKSDLYNLQLIDCKNATAFVPVIEFRESNETKISVDNNCVILHAASEEDIIKLKDLLLYRMLGIINN